MNRLTSDVCLLLIGGGKIEIGANSDNGLVTLEVSHDEYSCAVLLTEDEAHIARKLLKRAAQDC